MQLWSISGPSPGSFSTKLKSRFMESLIFQDYEYFEKHGAAVLQNRLNTDVTAVCDSIRAIPPAPCRHLVTPCNPLKPLVDLYSVRSPQP